MKTVGEPDAGNPPVRFDEGVVGNSTILLYHCMPEYTPVESATAAELLNGDLRVATL